MAYKNMVLDNNKMNYSIDFIKGNGLVPAIIQDFQDGEVLMLGYMNKEALDLSIKTGLVHYWSRSKKRIWQKGETSGHVQHIREIRIDCDSDTLLIKVVQKGDAACHEGYKSCFFRRIEDDKAIIDQTQIFDPSEKYRD